MIVGDGVGKGFLADEPHHVERVMAARVFARLVNRHDVGMLELTGDFRLATKAGQRRGRLGAALVDLLDRHQPFERLVARQPDASQAADAQPTHNGVLDQAGARRLLIARFARRRHPQQPANLLPSVRPYLIAQLRPHVARLTLAGREQFQRDAFVLRPIVRADHAAIHQVVGQRAMTVNGPGIQRSGDLPRIDLARLDRRHREGDVALFLARAFQRRIKSDRAVEGRVARIDPPRLAIPRRRKFVFGIRALGFCLGGLLWLRFGLHDCDLTGERNSRG